MKNRSILKNIRIWAVFFMAIFMIAVISLDLYSIISNYKVKRSTIRSDFIESKKLQLKEEVLNAIDLIDYARNKNKVNVREHLKNKCENMYSIFNTLYEKHSTHHSDRELKEIYFNILKKFRFQDNIGYFFIIDNKGYGVFHPYLEDYPGTPIHNTIDSFGKKAFYEVMNKLSKKDGVFHDYYWNVEDQKHNRLKLAYFKYFKQFNWIMASTLYLDEVEKGLKERLLDQIGKIRFGKDNKDYLFVMSNDGVVQMNDVQRYLIGTNLMDMKGPNGIKLVPEQIKLAKKTDGGFLFYKWQTNDSGELRDKLSYFHDIPDWDWYIGAGVYIDDVNLQIEKLYDELLENLKRKILYDVILFLIVFIVLYFVFEKNYKRFGNASDNIISEIEESVLSDKPLHIEEYEFKELKSFKNGFNQILKSKHETQVELEEERKRLERIIEGTEVGTWAWNIKTDEVIFNEKWANMLGYKLDELRPCNFNTFADLVHPDDIKIAEKRLTDHLEGKTDHYEIEIRMRHKDGHYIWVNDSGKVLKFDDKGKPLMAFGSHTDITEKKHFEENLKKTQAFITDIIDSMPSIIVAVDSNMKITQWNKKAFEFTKISVDKALGQNLSDVFKLLKDEMDIVEKSIKENELNSITKNAVLNSKKNSIFNITVYPLEKQGNSGAVIRIDDVTEATNLQAIIMQTEKMLSIGGLAAGMAHEINNPLSGIIQSVQNTMRRIDPDNPKNIKVSEDIGVDIEKVHEFLEKRKILEFLKGIKDSGERAASIVANMLQFSRAGSGELNEIDIKKILDDTIELSSSDYDLKKKYDFRFINIDKDYEKDLKKVYGNVQQLEQVFFNLFKNAAFAMSKAKIEEPTLKISIKTERNNIRIYIEDNGPGMDEETKKRAFDPFFTTKEIGEGTGLGLSVSYFIIVDKHNGKMWVEDSELGGARFVISLPIAVK